MKNLCVSMVLSLFVIQAYASGGHELGNGGDALVCPNSPVSFYDVYEAEHRFSMKPQFPEGDNEYKIAKEIVGRLRTLSPLRATGYSKWIEEFESETQFLTGKELIDVPDTNSGFLPKGCKIEQLLVQSEPKFPGEKRFVVNLDLWQQLSPQHRAAALVHEALLREGRLNKHSNSEYSRYLNAFLLSDRVSSLTMQEWFALLGKTVLFRNTDVDGFWIGTDSKSAEFDAKGEIISGNCEQTGSFQPFLQHTSLSVPWILKSWQCMDVNFSNRQVRQFEGYIRSTRFEQNVYIQMVSRQGNDIYASGFATSVMGDLIEMKIPSGLIEMRRIGKVVDSEHIDPVRIFASGYPEELSDTCGTFHALSYNGKEISYIKLNRQGEVLKVKECNGERP